ncbi:MAG: TetR/AcrR family transcriptional regulator [Desulfatitalea sp.]|nr:TetR/AcrR family transcriptional regulator [Desulfatitalea sp.]
MVVSSIKEQILNAAVEIMARKGSESSVAEIAAAAGVNVSHIYHYFKNKEDLLFHTAAAYMRDRIPRFKVQLQGIREPLSLLTKLIWEQLVYHEQNPNYAKFTLFECRPRKAFFRHEAFALFLDWARTMKEIILEGQRREVFSTNISATAARDTIQGLLDIENILYFSGKQKESPTQDYDAIIDLLLPMIERAVHAPTEEGGRKRETIIATAEKLFAEKGFARSTTMEIAKAAGLAERTLYEYFENKEDILFSAIQQRFQGYQGYVKELFEVTQPIGKLRTVIYFYFTIYLTQPAFVKTFILDGVFNPNFYQSKAYAELEGLMGVIDEILDQGKSEGSISPRLSNRLFKNMFLGIFSHSMLRWYFASERNTQFDMASWIKEVAILLTRAALRAGQADHNEAHK